MTLHICSTNSCVGARINTCKSFIFESTICKLLIEKVPVFPDPDCAWAITSLPSTTGLIAFF